MLTTVAPAPTEAPQPLPPRRRRKLANTGAMVRALVRKELRELAPLLLVAGLVQCCVLGALVGIRVPFFAHSENVIPFVNDQYVPWLLATAAIFGMVSGLWQTFWEAGRGTFQFLLHRPVPRQTLIATKLATGAGLTYLVGAIPLGLYTLWAATPGTHASPFAWSMTAWVWLAWSGLPLFYLGAFASGIRPARLYVSRFWPLAGAVLVYFIVLVLTSEFGWWIDLLLTPALIAGYLVAILHVAATRDFS